MASCHVSSLCIGKCALEVVIFLKLLAEFKLFLPKFTNTVDLAGLWFGL